MFDSVNDSGDMNASESTTPTWSTRVNALSADQRQRQRQRIEAERRRRDPKNVGLPNELAPSIVSRNIEESRSSNRSSLTAWVIMDERDPDLTADNLRRHLSASLPAGWCPTQFRVVDALPQTGNGKLHRR